MHHSSRPFEIDVDTPMPLTNGTGKKDEKPRYGDKELNQLRDDLFANGSHFLATARGDIVGIDNVLVEIDQLVHWLCNSEDYRKYNSRLEPGVLFEGLPGTGKTLVSRYIATASNALFVNIRDWPHQGSLFKDADIAALFAKARETYANTKRPIVLFWDEFENAAVERSQSTPEQMTVVSQLTAELDGIHGKNEGIILIGCTNYVHMIDKALRRAGRMGVHIEFLPPDREGKRIILEHYLESMKTHGEIDTQTLSYFFDQSATAADIEEACVEAWRIAVRRSMKAESKPSLAQEDLMTIFVKRLVGPPPTFVNLAPDKRKRVAIHEMGHAIAALIYDVPLRLITVQPGKRSLGRVITAEVEEHIGTAGQEVDQIRVGLGSIAAEKVAGLEPSIGANADVNKAGQIAARLIDCLYHGERTALFSVRAVSAGRQGDMDITPSVSPAFVQRSDDDIDRVLREARSDVESAMSAVGKKNLLILADEVNDRITMTGDEFRDLFVDTVGDPSQFRA
jgi:cell division protease FtsH